MDDDRSSPLFSSALNATTGVLTIASLQRGIDELKALDADARGDQDEARFRRAKPVQGTSRPRRPRALATG